jgi:catechol 2,3-dioxygenase-like lactoylglutathione lyase family enzyme
MPLNHVAITVSDRERSARFYAEHFGLIERVMVDRHLLLLASPDDGSLLALTEGEVPAGLPADNHFGFQVSEAEVRAARERMRAAGVVETEWQDSDGFVRVQVADPDGYRCELFAFATAQRPSRSRWTSFESAGPRGLAERGNPAHRLRVEHNHDTLLVHLSEEDGQGWTVMAVDRATRRWAVAQARRQVEAAETAFARLYPDSLRDSCGARLGPRPSRTRRTS